MASDGTLHVIDFFTKSGDFNGILANIRRTTGLDGDKIVFY